MKKILFLILTLFCINCFAGFISRVSVGQCGNVPFYPKEKFCKKYHSDCFKVPKNYDCNTFSEQDTEVDDTKSPIYSKIDAIDCDDQEHCESINLTKTCIDPAESVVIAEDYSEIYCTKWLRWNKKTIKMVRVDVAKKQIYDDAQLLIANQKITEKNDILAIKLKVENSEVLSSIEVVKFRKYMMRNLK